LDKKRIVSAVEPGYPTLADFACNRRTFLTRVAASGVAMGFGGLLPRCDLEPNGTPSSGTSTGGPWAGDISVPEIDAGTDSGTPYDAQEPLAGDDVGATLEPDAGPKQPDTGPTQPDGGPAKLDVYTQPDDPDALGGGMPEPEMYDVRLPKEGFTSTYIADDGYLTWAVAMKTYEPGFHDYFETHEEQGLDAARAVIEGRSCDEVEQDKAAIEDEIRQALEDHYAAQVGYSYPAVVAFELRVQGCEIQAPEDGDIADPSYP
jgi:hypothetical protein